MASDFIGQKRSEKKQSEKINKESTYEGSQVANDAWLKIMFLVIHGFDSHPSYSFLLRVWEILYFQLT